MSADKIPSSKNMDLEDRKIERMYRKQSDVVAQYEENLIDPDSEHLLGTMMSVEELWPHVRSSSEAARDARLVRTLSNLTLRTAEAMDVNIRSFRQEEFARRLLETTGPLSRRKLVELGQGMKPMFRRTPVLSYMYGALSSTSLLPEERETSRNRQGDKLSKLVRRTEEVVAVSRRGEGDGTEELVTMLMENLVSMWKEAGMNPVEYFRLVLDPNDFGASVENMFHFSFLVKEGKVKVEVDTMTRLPVVSPVSQRGGGDWSEEHSSQAVVINFCMEDWRMMVEGLSISKRRIEAPSWRYMTDGSEVTASDSESQESTISNYMRRHSREEKREKQIKRWDQQQIREELKLDKLRAGKRLQSAATQSDAMAAGSDHSLEYITHVAMDDTAVP